MSKVVIKILILYLVFKKDIDRNCRKGKFLTYNKLTHHITKSTKYGQLQSATYCY